MSDQLNTEPKKHFPWDTVPKKADKEAEHNSEPKYKPIRKMPVNEG